MGGRNGQSSEVRANSHCVLVLVTHHPVTPTQPRHKSRKHESHQDRKPRVIPVLPTDHRVPVQVRDVDGPAVLGVFFGEHPADVGPDHAFAGRVGVLKRSGAGGRVLDYICEGIARGVVGGIGRRRRELARTTQVGCTAPSGSKNPIRCPVRTSDSLPFLPFPSHSPRLRLVLTLMVSV